MQTPTTAPDTNIIRNTIRASITEYRARRNLFNDSYEGEVLSGSFDDQMEDFYDAHSYEEMHIIEKTYAMRAPVKQRAPLVARFMVHLWNTKSPAEAMALRASQDKKTLRIIMNHVDFDQGELCLVNKGGL